MRTEKQAVVLIISHSEDHEGVDLVSRAIVDQGGQFFRFDTDRFPTEVQLQLAYGSAGDRMLLVDGDKVLDLSRVTAVWYRRVATGRQLPQSMKPQLRDVTLEECRATLNGLIVSLDAFHLDPLYRIRRADNKQLQLKLARASGLEIPRTLTTNRPTSVRQFAATCSEGMVAKTLTSFSVYEQGEQRVMFTNTVTDADLQHLDSLCYGPCTFQEKLPKACELRVTVIGDKVFAASIDSQQSARTATDWRRDGIGLIQEWQPYLLPIEIEQQLLSLMRRLELNYGAADFVVTPDGRHVLLEVNPAGEFFWLEKFSPYFPLSDTLAERLLSGHDLWAPQ